MTSRAAARLVLTGAVVSLLSTFGTSAFPQKKTLSGRWSATAMRVAWRVGDWGKECGPKPGGGGAPAGTVTIKQQGGELSFSGAGRSYSTARCWETLPGMSVSHTGGSRGWRNVCKTGAGDPRQATTITTISATDDAISFDETGQYQFVIKGQNCTASVRRTRSFSLIQRDGEAPPKPKEEPKPKPEPVAEKPKKPARPRVDCSDLGDPARLEVRPKEKLMRPGDEFSFRWAVLDAKGCAVSSAPKWTIVGEAPAKMVKPGTLAIEDDAADAEFAMTAAVAGRSVRVNVQVVSNERYEALLAQGDFNEAGEKDEAAVAVIASSTVGGKSAVGQDKASGRKTTFLAIVGGLAVLFGLAGLVMVARSRKKKAERAPALDAIPRSRRATPGAMVCPTCRGEYPAGSQFCPNDGNRLVELEDDLLDARSPAGGVCPICHQGFDPGVQRCPEHGEDLVPAAVYRESADAIEPQKHICPICGKMYDGGDSKFCGEDGGALVPVN